MWEFIRIHLAYFHHHTVIESRTITQITVHSRLKHFVAFHVDVEIAILIRADMGQTIVKIPEIIDIAVDCHISGLWSLPRAIMPTIFQSYTGMDGAHMHVAHIHRSVKVLFLFGETRRGGAASAIRRV